MHIPNQLKDYSWNYLMKFILDLQVLFFCCLNRKRCNNRARMDHPSTIVLSPSLEVSKPSTFLIDYCTTNNACSSTITNDFSSSSQHLFLWLENWYHIDLCNRSDIAYLLFWWGYSSDLPLYAWLFTNKFYVEYNSN